MVLRRVPRGKLLSCYGRKVCHNVCLNQYAYQNDGVDPQKGVSHDTMGLPGEPGPRFLTTPFPWDGTLHPFGQGIRRSQRTERTNRHSEEPSAVVRGSLLLEAVILGTLSKKWPFLVGREVGSAPRNPRGLPLATRKRKHEKVAKERDFYCPSCSFQVHLFSSQQQTTAEIKLGHGKFSFDQNSFLRREPKNYEKRCQGGTIVPFVEGLFREVSPQFFW